MRRSTGIVVALFAFHFAITDVCRQPSLSLAFAALVVENRATVGKRKRGAPAAGASAAAFDPLATVTTVS